jgi:hypothetical protein
MAEIGNAVDDSLTEEEYLKQVAEGEDLPRVTIVRSDPTNGPLIAHVVLDGIVTPVEQTLTRRWPRNRPGLKNAFNVAFMHNFVSGSQEAPLETSVRDATVHALQNWVHHA